MNAQWNLITVAELLTTDPFTISDFNRNHNNNNFAL